MGRSNSSGVGTHTDGDGNLITIDENGSHVLLGQDEDVESADEPEPAEDVEPEDEKTPPESEQDPEREDPHQSSEDPAGGGFLIPELIVDHPPNEHEAE